MFIKIKVLSLAKILINKKPQFQWFLNKKINQ